MPVRGRVLSRPDPSIERQLDEMACGLACAVMLAADRGVQLAQTELRRRWRGEGLDRPALLNGLSPAGLAELLTEELLGGAWKGGDTSLTEPEEVLAALSGRSWATLLGPGRIGHWVVVDGRDAEGRVLVRDPIGVRRRYPLGAFLEAWYHREAVFEVSDG